MRKLRNARQTKLTLETQAKVREKMTKNEKKMRQEISGQQIKEGTRERSRKFENVPLYTGMAIASYTNNYISHYLKFVKFISAPAT